MRTTPKIQRIAIDEHYQLEIRTPNCASITCNIGGYNIAVRGIKEYKELSDETIAFSGSFYVNGRKAGIVKNSGCGGSNDIYWDNIALRNDFLETLSKKRMSLDIAISTIVCSNLDMKDSKAFFKKKGWEFSYGDFILEYKKSSGFPFYEGK